MEVTKSNPKKLIPKLPKFPSSPTQIFFLQNAKKILLPKNSTPSILNAYHPSSSIINSDQSKQSDIGKLINFRASVWHLILEPFPILIQKQEFKLESKKCQSVVWIKMIGEQKERGEAFGGKLMNSIVNRGSNSKAKWSGRPEG